MFDGLQTLSVSFFVLKCVKWKGGEEEEDVEISHTTLNQSMEDDENKFWFCKIFSFNESSCRCQMFDHIDVCAREREQKLKTKHFVYLFLLLLFKLSKYEIVRSNDLFDVFSLRSKMYISSKFLHVIVIVDFLRKDFFFLFF